MSVPEVEELIDLIERECAQLETADLTRVSDKHTLSHVVSTEKSTPKIFSLHNATLFYFKIV